MALLNPFEEADVVTVLTPSSWIVAAGFASEWSAPPMGYAVMFDDAESCLTWLQEAVFIAEADEVEDPADVLVAALIAEYEMHEPAAMVIHRALSASMRSEAFVIRWAGTVHEYLSEVASVEGWRRALSDPTISCEGGMWTLSNASWWRITRVVDELGAFTTEVERFEIETAEAW